jgi:hypothetical protein
MEETGNMDVMNKAIAYSVQSLNTNLMELALVIRVLRANADHRFNLVMKIPQLKIVLRNMKE